MIYLNKKWFFPFFILLNLVLLPLICWLLYFTIVDYDQILFIVLMAFLLIYFLILLVAFLSSKSKKYYLKIEENFLKITYPNISKSKGILIVNQEDILKYEYFKILSIRSWLQLFNYVMPRCVFMTYKINDEKLTELIGYMSYKEILEISEKTNTKLIVH